MRPESIHELRQKALQLLARREHSRYELRRKLLSKGWSAESVNAMLDELAAAELQSDTRFVEAYIRYRKEAGYGPRRISVELAERGIKSIPEEIANENSEEWWQALTRVWEKKKDKQIRFFIYRGFSPEQVYLLFKRFL